jgi:A nuclease of the HNH/ENDO VII superfamily with conserved WHH
MIRAEPSGSTQAHSIPPGQPQKSVEKPDADTPQAAAANLTQEHTQGGKVNTPELAKDLNREALNGNPDAPKVLAEVSKQLSASDRQILALDIAKDLDASERVKLNSSSEGRDYQAKVYSLATEDAPANTARPEVSALTGSTNAATPTSASATATDKAPAKGTPAYDAKSVNDAYNAAIEAKKSVAEASAAATDKLNEISANHANDPQYVNQVLQAARPTLDKVSTVLGENSAKNAHNGDADRRAMDKIVSDLSQVAKRGNDFTSLSIATSIAGKLANDKELHHADDSFDKYVKSTGDTKLLGTVIGVMERSGRAAGAQALRDQNDYRSTSFLGEVKDKIADGAKQIVDTAEGIKDMVVDGATGVAKVVTKAGEVAIDYAKGTIDVVGDVAKITKKDIQVAIEVAKQAGLALGNKVGEWVNKQYTTAINDLIDVKKIDKLEAGDSYTVDAEVSVADEIAMSAKTSLTVSKNDDGTYTVAADLKGGFGVGFAEHAGPEGDASATAEAKLGGRIEFKFANAADAAEGARLIVRTAIAGTAAATVAGVAVQAGAPNAALPVAKLVGKALAPGKADLDFLKQHVAAVEVSVGASVNGSGAPPSGAEQLGIGDKTLGDKLSKQLVSNAPGDSIHASANVESTYRIEYKDGKPINLVQKRTITLEGTAAGDFPQLRAHLEKLGINVPDLKANGALTIEVESRVPFRPGTKNTIEDLAKLTADPFGFVDKGAKVKNSVSIRVEGSVAVDDSGNVSKKGSAEFKISDIDSGEIPAVISDVLKGNYAAVGNAVDLSLTVKTYDVDTKSALNIPLGIGNVKAERVAEDRQVHIVLDKNQIVVKLGTNAPPTTTQAPAGTQFPDPAKPHANYPNAVEVTVDDKGRFNGATNAGPNAPEFKKWIGEKGGKIYYDKTSNTFIYGKEVNTSKSGVQYVEVAYVPGPPDEKNRPDFSPYATATVSIENVTGRPESEIKPELGDFAKAWKGYEDQLVRNGMTREQAVEFIEDTYNVYPRASGDHKGDWPDKSPRGLTWHHYQDKQTMILIDTRIHGTFTHQGGASLARE